MCKLEAVSSLRLDSEFYIFTDASNTAAAGYTDNLDSLGNNLGLITRNWRVPLGGKSTQYSCLY